jgi:hypothetical protein
MKPDTARVEREPVETNDSIERSNYASPHEPAWKTALNWGAVLVFFSLPIVLFVTQLWIYPNLEEEKIHLDYLRNFMNNVTILVFGLAGLRTWESIKANGKKNSK